jgi:putative two-component system response regulator
MSHVLTTASDRVTDGRSITVTQRNPRVLVIDDDPAVADLLGRMVSREGYDVAKAGDGPSAFAAISEQNPDVILLDVMLPGMNGFEICRRLKQEPRTRLIPIVMITGLGDPQRRIAGIEAGADDFLAKPVDPEELLARVRSLVRMKRYTDDLDSAATILMSLAVLIEGRDGNTQGHCHRMANYATSLGRRLGVSDDDLQALHRGGFLHDIGMLTIPDGVLNKTGPLEPEEYERIKSHTIVGDSLCGSLRSLAAVRPIIRWHHERLDGSGYPDGLRGDAIPVTAQIMGIVDVYDAVTTQRPYQRAKSIEDAVDMLRSQVSRGWRHKNVVEAFIGIVQGGQLDTFGVKGPSTMASPLGREEDRSLPLT